MTSENQGVSDASIEREIQAKGLTAPRLRPSDLDANIAHAEIVKHISTSGQVLRWAVLTTLNGFAVTGKPSASVSPENDDAEIGEKVAIDNARAELWPLMGYALKEQLHANAAKQEVQAPVESNLLANAVPIPPGLQQAMAELRALSEILIRLVNIITDPETPQDDVAELKHQFQLMSELRLAMTRRIGRLKGAA